MNTNEERQFKILEWAWKYHYYYFLDDTNNYDEYLLKPNLDNGEIIKDFAKKSDAILKSEGNNRTTYFIQNTSFSHRSEKDNFRKEEMQAYKNNLNNKTLINQINSQEQGKELIESLISELITEIKKKLKYDFNINENDEAILFITCNTRLMFENKSASIFANIIGKNLHNHFRYDNRIYNYSKIILVFNVNELNSGNWLPPIREINFQTGRDTINESKIFQFKLSLLKKFNELEILDNDKNFIYQNISMNSIYTKKVNKI